MRREIKENAKEKLNGAKKVSMMGFIGLLLAFAFSSLIGVLYTILSTYLSWYWPNICITATYILLWFLLCILLERRFNRTDADRMITHGVLVTASYDIAIFLILGNGGQLNWLAAISFLIAIGLSIMEE